MNIEETETSLPAVKSGVKAVYDGGDCVSEAASSAAGSILPSEAMSLPQGHQLLPANGLTVSDDSVWAKNGDEYQLYEGTFIVGANLRATAFGGDVYVIEDATVHGYNNARLIVSGKSTVAAHDQTLVVTHPERPFEGTLALSDQAQIAQNKMNFLGKLNDLRERTEIQNKLWIPTSTVEEPFVYGYKQYDADGLFAQRFQELRSSLVHIRRTGQGLDEGTGTGFWIGDCLFATAAHIIPESYDGVFKLISADGSLFEATLDRVSRPDDLAILRSTEPPISGAMIPVRLADSSVLPPGEKVLMVGFPGIREIAQAYPGTIRDSRVLERDAFALCPQFISNPDRELVATTAFGHPGTSGGPTVRLDSGELVGLTYGGEPRPEFPHNQYSGAQVDHLLITPVEKLSKLLQTGTDVTESEVS